MASVSVEKSAVMGAIRLCDQSIAEFQRSSKNLQAKYRQAGAGWKDSKYRQLGEVVEGCTKALDNPIAELEECKVKLGVLLKAIEEYENRDI